MSAVKNVRQNIYPFQCLWTTKSKKTVLFSFAFFHGKAKRQKDGYKTERARDGIEDRKRKFGGEVSCLKMSFSVLDLNNFILSY